MTDDSTDPDFNLQSFNDHGIFTVDELNELSFVIKPLLSAFHFIWTYEVWMDTSVSLLNY